MAEPLSEAVARLVEIAKQAGADHAVGWARRSRSVYSQVRDSKLEQIQESTDRQLTVELFVDGRYSLHGTNDVRPEALRSFVADAVALTRALEVDRFHKLPDPKRYPKPDLDLAAYDLHDPKLSQVSPEARLQRCLEVDARVAGKPGVISVTSIAGETVVDRAVANSAGLAAGYSATQAMLYAFATMRDKDDKRPEDGFGLSTRHLGELPTPSSVGDEVLRRARLRLGTKGGPTVRTTMVVDREAAGSLISRLVFPTDGWAVQQDRSMWAGSIGKRRVSEKLSIVSDPTLPRGLGSQPYDDEGMAALKLPIISAGVLENYFLNTYYAGKLEMPATTGNWGNIVVAPGKRDLATMIADVKDGIYVTSWLGGNADPPTGDFSLGLRGHRITKGKIGEPIGEMNVTGNLLQLFSDLLEVGGDVWPHDQVRTPSLVFRNVQFSGV